MREVLLAGVAGDCIGRPYEGRKRAVGPIVVPDGTWNGSDDTSLTLATCRAIARTGRVEPAAVAEELVLEFRSGNCRGLGASTLKALRDLAAGTHWALSGRSGEHAAGNGAAMRIAPLAFVMTGAASEERRLIRDVCRITHKNDEAYVAALAVVRAMHLVRAGAKGSSLLSCLADELPDTGVRDALREASELSQAGSIESAADLLGSSGHAVESVPLALLVVSRSSSCEEAILAAVQCGGDTDTIASIAGQVCAASGGSIPASWLARLPRRAEIEELVERLLAVA